MHTNSMTLAGAIEYNKVMFDKINVVFGLTGYRGGESP
jgi:hypothetical protein